MLVSGRGPEQPWKRGERDMVRAAKSKIAKKDKSDRLYQAILTLEY